MDMIMLGVLVIVAVGLVVYSVMPKKGAEERENVKRRLAGERDDTEIADIKQRARESARADLVKKATPVLTKIIMPTSDEDQTNLRSKLITAGFRAPNGQTVFLASKSILATVGLIIGLVAAFSTKMQMTSAVGAVCFGAGMGFMLPNLWLTLAISSRKQKVKDGLPDTLDLMVVSVESGLALDAAIKRVGDEMAIVHPELSEEMRIATMESQMGLPRSEALQNLGRRTDVEEVKGLVSVIVQAEKFGTSVAKALRNQADTLRTKRSQKAEERAQATAVKLLLPLVFFIFPALGIVLGGPAALRMIEALSTTPALGG